MSERITNKSENIDATFPLPGRNNLSAGFHENYRLIKESFAIAKEEIDNLQKRKIVVTGDASGETPLFGEGNAPITLNLTIDDIPGLGGSGGSVNTDAFDLNITVNSKGQVTAISKAAPPTTIAENSSFGPLSGTELGSGTGTFTLPRFTFDKKGRVKTAENISINYGLLNHTLSKGQLIVGTDTNKSTTLQAPASGNYFLGVDPAQPSGVRWMELHIPDGAIIGMNEGEGINIELEDSGNDNLARISLDLPSLSAITYSNLADNDIFAIHDTSAAGHRKITWSEIRNGLEGRFLKSVEEDENPVLGGDLNVNNKKIFGNVKLVTATSGSDVKSLEVLTDGLKLNGQVWPNEKGSNGQYLTTDANGNLSWFTPSNFYQTLPRTLFVAEPAFGGSDVTGNGALNNPFATISKALQTIPNTNELWTVMILGGSYNESITISHPKLTLEGFFYANKPKLTGFVNVMPGTSLVNFQNVSFDSTARPIGDTSPGVAVPMGANELTFNNCDFLRGEGDFSDLQMIYLAGDQTGNISFDNCIIQGTLSNNMRSQGGKKVTVSNSRQPGAGHFGLEAAEFSYTRIVNAPRIKGINHRGGKLELENVSEVGAVEYTISIEQPDIPQLDENRDPVLEVDSEGNPVPVLDEQGNPTSVPVLDENRDPVLDTDANGDPIQQVDDQGNPVFDEEGNPVYLIKMTSYRQKALTQPDIVEVHQAGLYSTANVIDVAETEFRNLLSLRNVNFYSDGMYSSILKLGLSDWKFENVSRRPSQDVINGSRVVYDTMNDAGEFTPFFIANGTDLKYMDRPTVDVPGKMLDPRTARIVNVRVTGDTTLKLKTPLMSAFNPGPETYSGDFMETFRVIVRQDEIGGHVVTWSVQALDEDGDAIIIPINWESDSAADSAANARSVFEFTYYSRSRRWFGRKIGSAGSSKPTSHLVNVPALAAGSFHTINARALFADPTLDCNNVMVEVTVLDQVTGSSTLGFYIPATVVATVAKKSDTIRVYNDSSSAVNLKILLKK